ncbi:MAG: nucleotide sugar dehydrogenase [Candidatus Omnitrophica bacterium]|nr:nucleotide sugar dehydrogenase [Candidatus Omnitrophota bacterium]
MYYKELKRKILARKATISVIGLGYVGLPLSCEFASRGFRVIGIDLDETRIRSIAEGTSYILDVPSQQVKSFVSAGSLRAEGTFDVLKEADAIIICVPTPLGKTREPDISYILSATEHISRWLRKGQLIVLESTTYPGTTEEIILPMLSQKGYTVGRDFFLAFSPERVDPGNTEFPPHKIPKVVGGVTAHCSRVAYTLYHSIIEEVIAVSTPRTAELVKLLENTFRSVNIALVNEVALMCNKLGADVWEVIRAAGSKPFGFMPFYPGPGLGGHCIPIDPVYLTWKSRLNGYTPKFIELAGEINQQMPSYVFSRIQDSLNLRGKSLKRSKILVIGVAYKRNVSDTRESPALEIMNLLLAKGAKVEYHDPYVPHLTVHNENKKSVSLTREELRKYDCVVVITDHSSIDYNSIVKGSKLIIDTRNALSTYTKIKRPSKKVVKL